jgi:hypothetical protein
MRIQILSSLLLAALAAALLSAPAFAQPQIVQTDCDTVSTDPVQVKITFAVMNPDPGFICTIKLLPVVSGDPPAEVCPISECAGPDSVHCSTGNGIAFWRGMSLPPEDLYGCVEQGETQDGFSIIIRSDVCCYTAAFYEAAILEPYHLETVCFACDRSVQIQTSTWGELKAIYR